MNFVCYKDKILKALNSVVKGVASKTTMPILEGILIQTNDNEIKLTTYDLELGIEYTMECDVKEQGSIVVNATMFTEIIRKLPDSEIDISVNENNLLTINCEGALYKLATMNPDEFPELPKIEIENSIIMEQSALKNMIRKRRYYMSKQDVVRKLTSRKFWLAVAAFVTELIIAFRGDAEQAETVSGIIMAGATVIAYIMGEGLVDAESGFKSTLSTIYNSSSVSKEEKTKEV